MAATVETERAAPAGPSAEARERALLAAVAARDGAALRELYHTYHRRLARFLMRVTSRYELAEEIINDTFCVVWMRAGDFRGASKVSTWIFGIAYRRALKSLRSLHAVDGGGEHQEASEDPGAHFELSDWLATALEQLPVDQRVVLELAYHAGHSCEEISSITDCPVNTVKTRMFHARRKLRSLLQNLAGSV
jgi:RNA polymerase sigma-70 factor, ECF subfamily